MAVEDFMEPEVAIAVAVTAAVSSPRARKVMRRGAVYGMAGILMAGDALRSFASGVSRGVQQSAAAAADLGKDVAEEAKAERSPRAEAPRRAARAAKQEAEPEGGNRG